MFLRYRQTPLPLKRVKAHAVGREHQLLLLCVLFEFWRISRTRMQANAFYLYVFCLFYSFIGTMLFANRMQIYDLFLETQCVAFVFVHLSSNNRSFKCQAIVFCSKIPFLSLTPARRQFVPTNCPCSPRQTIGEIRP